MSFQNFILFCDKKVAVKKHQRADNKDSTEDNDVGDITLFNNFHKIPASTAIIMKKNHSASFVKCKGFLMDEKMLKKLAPYSVLYAEDEAGVRKNVYELLSLLFKDVYLATDGEEAYTLFMEHKPDLIITDIKMPHLSGIDLAKKIRQNDNKAHIIIITAYTEVDFMLEAIELSLLRYIVKPITEPKLFDALGKFLQAKEKANLQELLPDWYYDALQKIITHENAVYELTKKEAKLIELLLEKDSIITYEEIEQNLWETEYMSLNALRLMIKNLRKKLPEGTLKNIQGIGYKL